MPMFINFLKQLRAVAVVVLLGTVAVLLSIAFFISRSVYRAVKAAFERFYIGVLDGLYDIVKDEKQKQEIERLRQYAKRVLFGAI